MAAPSYSMKPKTRNRFDRLLLLDNFVQESKPIRAGSADHLGKGLLAGFRDQLFSLELRK
jgi:hypothetical protein